MYSDIRLIIEVMFDELPGWYYDEYQSTKVLIRYFLQIGKKTYFSRKTCWL
jgi:hypothetical protein